jgi:hypothetical protein
VKKKKEQARRSINHQVVCFVAARGDEEAMGCVKRPALERPLEMCGRGCIKKLVRSNAG